MARIRTIKPEFFTSEDIVSLSPLARLLYIALWCEADREGRLSWKPRTLKMRYFPADDCDIESLCGEILSLGMVRLYGNGYAYIPSFHAHQHVNPREQASQLPSPRDDDALTTREPRVKDASSTSEPRDSDVQGGRKERKGKEHASERDALFDRFWKTYPNKVGKDAARQAFDKRNPDDALVDLMVSAVELQKQSSKWTKDDGEYIPHPATWLNQGRWQDEGVTDGEQSEGGNWRSNPAFAGVI